MCVLFSSRRRWFPSIKTCSGSFTKLDQVFVDNRLITTIKALLMMETKSEPRYDALCVLESVGVQSLMVAIHRLRTHTRTHTKTHTRSRETHSIMSV